MSRETLVGISQIKTNMLSALLGTAAAAAAGLSLLGGPARADATETPEAPAAAVTFTLDYKLDVMGPVSGGVRAGQALDNLALGLDADLDRAFGWSGMSAHLELSNTSGGAAGDLAPSLQGVDNIEVGARRLRLYQAWVEAALGDDRVNLRAGFSDASGEFAVADSSGLLLNPSFGAGPDFAASGAPAYPSTALGLRLRVNPSKTTYVQAMAANARAGVPGDADGADTSFDDGEVLLAEAGWTGRGKVAVGAWRLTRKQDDLFAVDKAGDPVRRTAQGAYVVVEQPLAEGGEGARAVTGFLRAGMSDGDTSPFKGSVQAGVLVEPVFLDRQSSSLSLGVTQARLGSAYRSASAAAGAPLGADETVFEATYSDMVTKRLRVQPDLQFIRRPGGDRSAKDVLVAGVRFNLAF